MKVSSHNIVIKPVNERTNDLNQAIKNVKIDDVVSAKIIRRIDKAAILQIFGVRIRADFTDGPPSSNSLNLVLKAKGSSGIIFKIAQENSGREIPAGIFDVLLKSAPDDLNIYEIVKFIKSSNPGIFDLNLFIMGGSKEIDKQKKRNALFNSFLKKGLSPGAVSYLSYLSMSGTGYESILRIISQIFSNNMEINSMENESAEDEIEDFFRNNDRQLLKDYLDDQFDQSESPKYSKFYYPEDDSLKSFNIISEEDSCIIDMDLSGLGKTVVHTQKVQDSLSISFYLEDSSSLLAIKERSHELMEILSENGVNRPVIMYNNLKKIVDIMADWSTYFYMKKEFDVKV